MKGHSNIVVESEVNVQHPYLGLSSFHEKHKAYFHGRAQEVNILKKYVNRSALTVFFGKSGLGKSSLLRAGLFPALRKSYKLPIYLRINFSQSRTISPLDQIKNELTTSIQAMDADAPDIEEMSLWEYFHRVKILNGLVTPVLVFDQFEEVFTLGNHNQVNELFTELGDLIENRVPLSVQEKYIDEIFPFQHQVQNFRVIFSLREDYLAQLENFTTIIPSISKNRFRIRQLNLDNAFEAVYEPAKTIIEKEEAHRIVNLLAENLNKPLEHEDKIEKSKIEIEPFLLSLICDRINELRFDNDGNMIEEKITSDILDRVDINEIISNFYQEVAESNSEELNEFIEKHLLTSDGYRRLQPLVDTQELHNVPIEEIQELIDKRILRKEIWNGREQVELIHDVLVPVVRERRDVRMEEEKDLEIQKALEKHKKEQERVLAEKREKKRQRRGFILLAFLTMLISAFLVSSYYKRTNRLEQERREKMVALSEELNFASSNMTIWNSRLKGILARHSYDLLIESGDKINEDVYKAMYQSLEYLEGPGFKEDYKLLRNGNLYNDKIRSLNVNDDKLLSISKDGLVINWDFNKHTLDTLFELNKTCYTSIADFKNDNLFLGGRFNQINMLSLKDNSIIKFPISGDTRVLIKGENKVFGAGSSGKIYSWSKSNNQNEIISSMDSILFSSNHKITALADLGEKFAVATKPDGIFLFDKKSRDTSRLVFRNEMGNKEYIKSLKFIPDKNILIIGGSQGILKKYDLNKEIVITSNYVKGGITDIDYNHLSSLIVATSDDGRMTIWDLDSNERLLTFLRRDVCPIPPANFAAFDVMGNNLFIGYNNGSIIKFPVKFNEMADNICTALNEMYKVDTLSNPNLSEAEWIEYFGEEYKYDSKYKCLK